MQHSLGLSFIQIFDYFEVHIFTFSPLTLLHTDGQHSESEQDQFLPGYERVIDDSFLNKLKIYLKDINKKTNEAISANISL